MSWSTCNVFNPQVGGSRAYGDAIISCSDFGVENGDVGGHLYVDAVGVRAVSVGHDLHSLHLHILASIEHYVEHLTVQRGQPTNTDVIRVGETQRLNTNTKPNQHNTNKVISLDLA